MAVSYCNGLQPDLPDPSQPPPPLLPKPDKANARLQKLIKKSAKKKARPSQTPIPFRSCLSPVHEASDLEHSDTHSTPPRSPDCVSPIRPLYDQHPPSTFSFPPSRPYGSSPYGQTGVFPPKDYTAPILTSEDLVAPLYECSSFMFDDDDRESTTPPSPPPPSPPPPPPVPEFSQGPAAYQYDLYSSVALNSYGSVAMATVAPDPVPSVPQSAPPAPAPSGLSLGPGLAPLLAQVQVPLPPPAPVPVSAPTLQTRPLTPTQKVTTPSKPKDEAPKHTPALASASVKAPSTNRGTSSPSQPKTGQRDKESRPKIGQTEMESRPKIQQKDITPSQPKNGQIETESQTKNGQTQRDTMEVVEANASGAQGKAATPQETPSTKPTTSTASSTVDNVDKVDKPRAPTAKPSPAKAALNAMKPKSLKAKFSGWSRLKKHMVVEPEEPQFPEPESGSKDGANDSKNTDQAKCSQASSAEVKDHSRKGKEVLKESEAPRAMKMWDAMLFQMFSTKEAIMQQIKASKAPDSSDKKKDRRDQNDKTQKDNQQKENAMEVVPSFAKRLPLILYSPRFDARKIKGGCREAAGEDVSCVPEGADEPQKSGWRREGL
ncbi:unnamed protein product [Coregonus sp. 'balchen']|nr:unnamed protein product [Coregonus sp. 'balchen']